MDETTTPAPEPTETPAEQPPAVRVPNVHTHAVSGLEGVPLGTDATSATDTVADTDTVTYGDLTTVQVPEGSIDEVVAWVGEPDEHADRALRADAAAAHLAPGLTEAGAEELYAGLRGAVYRSETPADEDPEKTEAGDPESTPETVEETGTSTDDDGVNPDAPLTQADDVERSKPTVDADRAELVGQLLGARPDTDADGQPVVGGPGDPTNPGS